MTNKKQQRADIIENTIERYDSDLMCHIQQHVINEFMDTDVDDEEKDKKPKSEPDKKAK